MRFDRVVVGLHCHSLDDFPIHEQDDRADSLLICWTALWHPLLIAHTRRTPDWTRLNDPIAPLSSNTNDSHSGNDPGHSATNGFKQDDAGGQLAEGDKDPIPGDASPCLLVVIPRPYTNDPDEAWVQEIEQAGGHVVRHGQADRSELVAELTGRLPGDETDRAVEAGVARDFLALGFAYLQIELLTRHMHYSTQMSETAFEESLILAAEAAVRGDDSTARDKLQSCFDFLSQERDHYYAVDLYLIDISLVASPLLGQPLRDQLECSTCSNLLLEARLLEELQTDYPDTLDRLRTEIESERIGMLGGAARELPTTLVPTDVVLAQLRRGAQLFERLLGQRPTVFGRRTFGLAPSLPQLLLKYGYEGALHATFDGGRFPEGHQAKSRWEGTGSYSVDALLRPPLDASQPGTFLKLASELGYSIDTDHIATKCFVHWAGQNSLWYDELRHVSQFTQSLGRFVTIQDYFRDTYDPGLHDSFRADQYRSPLLSQKVAAGDAQPISFWPRYWRSYLAKLTTVNCCTLRLMVDDSDDACQAYRDAQQRFEAFLTDLEGADDEADTVAHQAADDAALAVAAALAHSDAAAGASSQQGYLLLNAFSFPRRATIVHSDVHPEEEQPIYVVSAESEPGPKRVVADAPALGMTIVRDANPSSSGKPKLRRPRKAPPPMAAELKLRNEFLEAELDEQSGGLRSLRTYGSRNNRIAHKLVFRHGPVVASELQDDTPIGQPHDSTMVADSIQTVEANSVFGCIQIEGRLQDGRGETIARFVQTYQLVRGSRVLQVDLTLSDLAPIGDKPWSDYIAARFAWPNEAADISRSLNDVRLASSAKRIEAPLFLQIDDGTEQTAILTGGLPYHVRTGRRMLDTLLVVQGEAQRTFRWGLGVDLKQPFREALSFISPATIVESTSGLPEHASAWLFHVDARNVIATQWNPVWENSQIRGLTIRLIETEGRATRVTIRSIRPFQKAHKVDGWGKTVESCEVIEDRLICHVAAYECIDVETEF